MSSTVLKIKNGSSWHDYSDMVKMSGLGWKRNDLDADGSGRSPLDGLMWRSVVARKRTLSFDAMPDRAFPLQLKEFAAQADPRTNTYPVTAVMPHQPDVYLLPGMAVTVEVDFRPNDKGKSNEKYFVPSTAILNEGANGNFVWRYENSSAHRVPVTVGAVLV